MLAPNFRILASNGAATLAADSKDKASRSAFRRGIHNDGTSEVNEHNLKLFSHAAIGAGAALTTRSTLTMSKQSQLSHVLHCTVTCTDTNSILTSWLQDGAFKNKLSFK